MTNRKFLFFAMLGLIFGMAAFGVQQTTAAKAALNLDGGHHGGHDDDDDDDDHGVKLLVDNDKVQCPNAQYTTIQAAVNAAPPGAVILVCPGTYPEEVRVAKPLTIRGIRVGNENLAVIMPPIAAANTISFGGTPTAAIVLVEKTSGVTLDNLTVDGASNLIAGCAPNLVGIYYRNASGRIVNAAVRNIMLFPTAGLGGCQSGLGIYAQAGIEPGFPRRARLEVFNSSVHDYQKNGITADATGTELTAAGNAVTGLGPTPQIAQNGFQVSRGAKGRLESNSVINHIYSLCTPSSCAAVSTNIIIFETSLVKLLKNNLGKAQVNVYLEGSNNDVTNNTIFDTDVFDGVFILGNNNKVTANSIFNSDEAAVWIDGNNNHVNGNTFNEAPIGVFNDGTGNHINGNRYYNIAERILPAPMSATALSRLSAGGNARNTSPAQP